MTPREIGRDLAALVQLDQDAVAAYDRAIAALGDGPIAAQLAAFRLDHQRHVLELSQLLVGMGQRPPQAGTDVKGAILGGLTAVRARLGAEQALRAMRTNEQLTTSSYAQALARPFPEEALAVIRRGDADEQRHLAWIERAIDGRIWDAPGPSPGP